MIYLDMSNTLFLRQDFQTGTLECVRQEDAELGANWEAWEGTQEDFDQAIRCQAPIERIPWALRED